MIETKIAFIADSQLGKRLYGLNDTYKDWLNAFKSAGQSVIQRKDEIAAVVLLGDTFDAEAMYAQEINLAKKVVKEIQDAGIKVYGILGNHDKGQSDQNKDIISWYDVCDIITLHSNAPILLEGNTEVSPLWLVGIHHQAKQLLAKTLEELKAPDIAKTREVLLLMHQSLKELTPSGFGWEVETNQVPPWVSRVFLGDFHNACSVKDKQGRIFQYPGAIETVSFNQETEPGFILYDRVTRTTEHISTKQREYLKIEISKLPDNWQDVIAAQIEKAKQDFNNKPVLQIIMDKPDNREAEVKQYCDLLALKVVTTHPTVFKDQTVIEEKLPNSAKEVIELAGELLPKTELGDLARNLLQKPTLDTLRDWQKQKFPKANTSDD